VHPKHHTNKQNSSHISIVAIHLFSNETLLMAVTLFTVLLNKNTFFF